jgi:hypothetical protein
MKIKQLTDNQRLYIEAVLKLICEKVGHLNIDLTLDEYSCIEFVDERETNEIEIHIGFLTNILENGEYNNIDADYLNSRKKWFNKMLKGCGFAFTIHNLNNPTPLRYT